MDESFTEVLIQRNVKQQNDEIKNTETSESFNVNSNKNKKGTNFFKFIPNYIIV